MLRCSSAFPHSCVAGNDGSQLGTVHCKADHGNPPDQHLSECFVCSASCSAVTARRPSRSASCSAIFFLCREASPAHTRDCALSRAKVTQRLPRYPCWSAHMCNTLCSSTSPVLFFSVVAESCSCYHRQKGIGQSHLTFPYLVVQTVGRMAGEATPRSRNARTSCLCH